MTESNIDQEVKQALSKPKDTIASDQSKKQGDTGSQLANTRISNCGQCEEVPAILVGICVSCLLNALNVCCIPGRSAKVVLMLPLFQAVVLR